MARVSLSTPGEDVQVGGSDIQLFGTNSGGEVITFSGGNITLDASFNRGGDTLVLPGDATSYTAYRTSSEVVITRADNGVVARIPVGTAGMEVQFGSSDSRTLLFDRSINQITLEGQVIGTNSAAPTPLVAPGSTPAITYDVIGANASVSEGDSGTKLLQFTVGLDRPVETGNTLTLNYQTQDVTAAAGSDYVAASGTVTFAAGQQNATVSVTINGDTVVEGNETLSLLLTGANLRNGPETLVGTITNDDNTVALTSNADNLQGTSGNDSFAASNTALASGDAVSDSSTTDADVFTLTVDGTTGNRTFSGFTLTNIETVQVNNNSGQVVAFSLSNSSGMKSFSSAGGSDGVALTLGSGQLSGSLALTFGAGASDSLTVAQSVTEANFALVTGLETLTVATNGTTNLGSDGGGSLAQTAGIRTVNLNLNGAGGANDTLIATDYSAGLVVNLGGQNGADTVQLGAGADTINISQLGGDDNLQGGGGIDTLNVTDGISTSIEGLFTGLEVINYLSDGDGEDHILTVNNANAPTAGNVLTISAANFSSSEQFTFGADVVTGYTVNLTTGGGDDSLFTTRGNDVVSAGGGNDLIVGGPGADLLTGGAGVDSFRYLSVEDSRLSQVGGVQVDNRDTITDFTAGVDKIDLTQLNVAIGQTIRFRGDVATLADAQTAVAGTGSDSFLDVVFARNSGGQQVLFVDSDNNGQLDNNDLQIVFTGTVGTLTAPDVNNPHLVTGPEVNGTFPMLGVAAEPVGLMGQYAELRFDEFTSMHIA